MLAELTNFMPCLHSTAASEPLPNFRDQVERSRDTSKTSQTLYIPHTDFAGRQGSMGLPQAFLYRTPNSVVFLFRFIQSEIVKAI